MDALKNCIKDYGQFLVGIGIIIVSIFLYCIASEQTNISRNVASITKDATRPYLVIEDFRLRVLGTVGVEIIHLVAGKRFIVDYIIRNKGQTPAYNVIDSVRTAILDSGATLPMPPHNWNDKFIVGSEIQRFKQSQHIFSEEIRRKISAKLDKSPADHWVYFWGKITYTDISDNTYWTEFGHRYIFEHGQWFPYNEYNKAN